MTAATTTSTPAARAAERLLQAAETGRTCPPVRDLIGPSDVAAAYATQQILTEHRVRGGGVIVGRKIGLTSPAVQRQLGVDRPDFGFLFADMQVQETDLVPMARLLQPRIEAEIAFELGADLADGPLDVGQVRAAVARAVPALEIVDSRITGWDISFSDTVADNASSGMFVLGTDWRTLDDVEPVSTQMVLTVDGVEASRGVGAACLGDPLEALRWLALTARDTGEPLRAGQIILSGALGPMVPFTAGSTVTAQLTGYGAVTARADTNPDPIDSEDGS